MSARWNFSRGIAIVAIVATWQLHAAPASAQSADRVNNSRSFFALPVELDVDRGAANGDAAIVRIMPVYTFPVRKNWKLVHMSILSLADAPSGTPIFPGSSGSGNNAGLSDFLHTSFYTPVSTGNLVWGLGIMASLPTATASGLGSGKWTVGPAFRVTYRTGAWNFGLVGGQRRSFAGSGNRPDVNQLMMRGAIRRQLRNEWFFVSAPIIVANWDAPGEKWIVPVGGGVGRRFEFGGKPWAFSMQAYYNAIRPEGAPDWVVRAAVVAAIPFGK